MKKFTLSFLGAALLLACLLSPFASSSPDGLEKVAESEGFETRATEVWAKAPMADYALGSHPMLQTPLAGAAGTLLVFALLMGGGKVMARRHSAAS